MGIARRLREIGGTRSKSRRSRGYHQCEALYIIRTKARVYLAFCEYIIKPQGNARWRVMRYKGGLPPLMICTALRAAMICQACGLDKKIPRTKFSVFFCLVTVLDDIESYAIATIEDQSKRQVEHLSSQPRRQYNLRSDCPRCHHIAIA